MAKSKPNPNPDKIQTKAKKGQQKPAALVKKVSPNHTKLNQVQVPRQPNSSDSIPTTRSRSNFAIVVPIPQRSSEDQKQQISTGSNAAAPKLKSSQTMEVNIPSVVAIKTEKGSTKKNRKKKNKPKSHASNAFFEQLPTTVIPVAPKLSKRFYEALVLLTVLGKNRGERIDEEEFETDVESPDVLDNIMLRRSFTRHLAYLCDYDKGGDSTTAIALEQSSSGNVYHFASNKSGCSDRSLNFLKTTLGLLQKSTLASNEETEEILFALSVKHSAGRVTCYASFLAKDITFVLEELTEPATGKEDSSFTTWLLALKDLTQAPLELCRFCYNTTASIEYRLLQQQVQVNTPLSTRFDRIRHTIGRLNHTLKAVKILTNTRSMLPHLFHNFSLSRIPSSASHPPPLLERNPTVSEILGRITSDEHVINQYRSELEYMDHKYQLNSNLQQHCGCSTWKPQVHAELLILDYFWTQDLSFVDEDKYIACSKPACYCCYHYMRLHPGKFVVPGSHNNNYLNWRAPDVRAGEWDREDVRQGILNAMAKVFRDEIRLQICEMRGPKGSKPDSMTEISELRLGKWDGGYGEVENEGEIWLGRYGEEIDGCQSLSVDGRSREDGMEDEIGELNEETFHVGSEEVFEPVENNDSSRYDSNSDLGNEEEEDGGVLLGV